MNNAKLFVISGPSGAGKGTVISRVMEKMDKLSFSVSATTRAPRDGEIDGVHYYFISRQSFEDRISEGEFLEYATYVDNYYGTPRTAVEEKLRAGCSVILDIEVQGAEQVKKAMPEAVRVFLTPSSYKELHCRLMKRGTDSPEKIESRMKTAAIERPKAMDFDYIIINDDLDRAVNELCSIITAELCRASDRYCLLCD